VSCPLVSAIQDGGINQGAQILSVEDNMVAALFGDAVRKVIAGELNLVALLGVTERLKAAGESQLAAELYKIWIGHNASDPLLHAVYFNYGITLTDIGDWAGARTVLEEAIRLNPDFYPPYINLGTVLERFGATEKAVNQWLSLSNRLAQITGENISYRMIALQHIGRVLETAKIDRSAEEALRQILDVDPTRREVLQHWINVRQRQCKWPVLSPWGNLTKTAILKGIFPLNLAALSDDAMFQLSNAYSHNRQDVGYPPGIITAGGWATPEAPRSGRLRIGYLSSDMRGHAVGYLTVEIFGLHDREKVEVFVYYCGLRVRDDPIQNRVKEGADHWLDINDMSDREAARRMVDDGIDILVDLNGYSMNSRTRVAALRPAPIIVNWLGYPGTMGSPYHNYIIADDHIVPEDFEIFYSEKVVRLPCYQPNDRTRASWDLTPPTRQDEGLPESGLIYCCLNGAQKITRVVFRRWMTILREVPDSVLWLLKSGDETDERLRQMAAEQGVAGERLVFSGRKPNAEHLARYRLADLFLDTGPYGSHTTASDALWMGLPIVTVSGRSFAARVCGSLVRAAGLEDLICKSGDEYVARAIDLGLNPEKIAAYKQRLRANRDSCTLFDTPRLVRSLEDLYQNMWNDYCAGMLPQPDLSNLDVYNDIGADEDHEDINFMEMADYREFYKFRLAFRHSISPVPYDRRLWTAPDADNEERRQSRKSGHPIQQK
jgi:predicted O-linked N-acetylglucosamine transferase (SPINDLY family)